MGSGTLSVAVGGTSGPVLEPHHQILDGIFHASDWDIKQIWNGYFPILGFPNVQGYQSVVIEVEYLLVVDFEEGHEDFVARLFLLHAPHDHLERTREDPTLFAGQKIKQVLLAVLWGVVSDHGVGLTCPCLPVCKYGDIDAVEELPDGVLHKVEHVLLR